MSVPPSDTHKGGRHGCKLVAGLKSGWTVKQKLIVSEVASYTAGGLVIIYYWTNASYVAVGVVFTVEYFVSIVNTYLWFQRTD
jgi:membrane protease YdiL (CAAX protease family)